MWVFLTVCAAFVQNMRLMLQKQLAQTGLSPAGATFARFFWSAPVIVCALFLLLQVTDSDFPTIDGRFLGFVILGGVTQIIATLLVILLFSHRNFAVGTSFKRSETILSAVIGVVILGDTLPLAGWFCLALGLIGVVLLSKNPLGQGERVLNLSVVLGLGSGLFFGICGVCYRAASLSLDLEGWIVPAVTTLTFSVVIQLAMMFVYFGFREAGEVGRVIRAWRITGLVSLTSVMGSSLIFSAFTLQNVAYVNAVQQIELIFAALGSYFFFKERITPREIWGMVIVSGSIVLLLLVG